MVRVLHRRGGIKTMRGQDPLGTGGTPNLYDRNKYSAVLDANSGAPPGGRGVPPGAPMNGYAGSPMGYPGAPTNGYVGSPMGYPGNPMNGYAGAPGNPMNGYPENPTGGYGGEFRKNFMGMPSGGMNRGMGTPQNGSQPPVNAQSISATLAEMEELRKKINSQTFWAVFSMVAIFIVIFILRMNRGNLRNNALVPLLPFFIIACAIVFVFAMKGESGKKKRLKYLYKETFVRQMLNQHFQDVYYNWEQGMDQMLIKASGVCRLGNRYHSEDYLNAVYRGIRFQQADVTIQYHTSNGKNSHTTTYFQGRMFCFEYPTKRSLAVQVFSKNFLYAGEPGGRIRKDKLQMESVEFNKEFTVRSEMEHDAFYILTPQMMERLMALKRKYGNVTLVFDRGYLMVGLNSRMDSFDANLHKPIDYQNEMMRMRADVAVIEELIQLLNCIPN